MQPIIAAFPISRADLNWADLNKGAFQPFISGRMMATVKRGGSRQETVPSFIPDISFIPDRFNPGREERSLVPDGISLDRQIEPYCDRNVFLCSRSTNASTTNGFSNSLVK